MAQKKVSLIQGLIEFPQIEAVLLMEAGYLLLQMGRLKEAHELFEGVVELIPHSDVPVVALSNLYFAEGKFALAEKEARNALKRDPKSATAYAHLGEALLFQKKATEGIAALQSAVDIDPKAPPAAFARELMKAHKEGNLK